MTNYSVDKNGYYGEFGGAYVPEILFKTVENLREAYLPIIESEEFQKEFHRLLRDYVGAPRLCFMPAGSASAMERKSISNGRI